MRLYLANCTKQEHRIFYRLNFDGESRSLPKHQDLPAGRQAVVGGEFDGPQIEEIVKQLTRSMGLVGVKDVARLSRAQGQVALVFDVDKMISADTIRTVMAHNNGTLITQGVERRKLAAIAASTFVDTKQFQVGFEQVEVSDNGEKAIAEGVIVKADAPDGNAPRRPGRPRKAA